MESFFDASSLLFSVFAATLRDREANGSYLRFVFLPVFVCCSCVICDWLRALLVLSLARPGKVDGDDDDNVGLHTTFTYLLYEH